MIFFLDIYFGQKPEIELQLVEHIWTDHPNDTLQQQGLNYLIAYLLIIHVKLYNHDLNFIYDKKNKYILI